MLPLSLATWIARLGAFYLLLGVAFAVPFAFRWVNRMNPVAAHGTTGFRLLILPGSVLLWPILLGRMLRRETAPPVEHTAPRDHPA